MIPSLQEIITKLFEKLSGDVALSTLVAGKIFNNTPQDTALPFVRFRFTDMDEWDTKDSDGWRGYFVIDVFTDARGDLFPAQIADAVLACLHLQTLPTTSGQHLYCRHGSTTFFTESDGLTHRAVIRFDVIFTN